MTEITILLLLTTVTGSLVLVVWYVVGFVLDRLGYLNILYRFLQMLPLFYLVPVTYLIFIFGGSERGPIGGAFSVTTPGMRNFLAAAGVVWLAGAIVQTVRWQREQQRIRRITKDSRTCTAEEREVFERVRERMGVRSGKVAVRCSLQIPSPFLYGICHPVIFLPEEKMPGDTLEIAMIHELTHFRHHDLIFKRMALWLTVLYWFNPFVYLFAGLSESWSEYACDYGVLQESVGLKRYIRALMGEAQKAGETEGSHFTTSAFWERRSMMYKRIRRMSRYRGRKRPPRIIFILLCMTLLFGSSLSVVAASQGAKTVYGKWYDATREMDVEAVDTEVVVAEADVDEEDLVEYEKTMTEEDWERMEVGEANSENARMTGYSFSWTVGADLIKSTSSFYVSKDFTITVMVSLEPTTVYARVGIITPSGVMRYVKVKDSATKKFTLTKSGYYYIFVENCYSSSKIYVDGMYTIRRAS